MKLNDRGRHMMVNIINELREETNHHEMITWPMFFQLKRIFSKASNRAKAKAEMKERLGW